MRINWKILIANKKFWVQLIPAVIAIAIAVARLFGIELNLSDLESKLLDLVEAVFILVGVFNIIDDPTQKAYLKFSERAMTYTEPWRDEDEKIPMDEDISG